MSFSGLEIAKVGEGSKGSNTRQAENALNFYEHQHSANKRLNCVTYRECALLAGHRELAKSWKDSFRLNLANNRQTKRMQRWTCVENQDQRRELEGLNGATKKCQRGGASSNQEEGSDEEKLESDSEKKKPYSRRKLKTKESG